MQGLPGDKGIDGRHVIALSQKKTENFIARPLGPGRCTDHGDSPCRRQQCGNILIAFEQHEALPSSY